MNAIDRAITRAITQPRPDSGQSTAEYALMILGAAAIALALISWVSRTDLVEKLLEFVFSGLIRKAK